MFRNLKKIKQVATKNKKLHIVGIVGVPGNYGGFETLVDNLLDSNKLKFLDVYVYCEKFFLLKNHSSVKYKDAHLIPINLKANGWQSILYDLIGMIYGCCAGGTILVLGTSATFAVPMLRLFFPKTKFLVNMAGLEWSRSKWNMPTRNFLKFNERMAAKYSDILITDNEGLSEHVLTDYKCTSVYIPYGGDQFLNVDANHQVFEEYAIPESYDFAMARAQIDNNIEVILDAYIEMNRCIVFVSNWSNNEYGKKVTQKYKKYKNIFLIGPIYDVSKIKALHTKTMFYIHGHSAGGTNPVLVESMWSKLPVVAYDVTFNRYTTGNYAIYFNNSEDLKEILTLRRYNSESAYVEKMWQKANQTYVWDKIIKSYEEIIL